MAAFLGTDILAQDIKSSSFASILHDRMSVVENPKDALTVFDMEATARTKVQQGHWAYMSSGTDDDSTLLANREGFRHVRYRREITHRVTGQRFRMQRRIHGVTRADECQRVAVGRRFGDEVARVRRTEPHSIKEAKRGRREAQVIDAR